MFKKILIAEDFDSINHAVKYALNDLNIPIIDQVFYCTEALYKIQRALAEKKPYDLLITDLSFSHILDNPQINDGKELISAVKKIQPSIKIIVLSIENRTRNIKNIHDNYNIDAFISKGRGDLKELIKAINDVYQGKNYTSNIEHENHVNDITDEDIELVRLLSTKKVDEISLILKNQNVKACSISSINKRIKHLKDIVNANSLGELIKIFFEMGLLK